jgi:hypothetical protein
VRASRATGKSSDNSWHIEYTASAGKSAPRLPEDAMVNLLLVESMSPDTGAPLRVVLFKSFKLPKSASGSTDIAAPAGSKPRAIVAVLQHGKTMRLLGVSRTELR